MIDGKSDCLAEFVALSEFCNKQIQIFLLIRIRWANHKNLNCRRIKYCKHTISEYHYDILIFKHNENNPIMQEHKTSKSE